MNRPRYLLLGLLLAVTAAARQVAPVPSRAQLAWQQLEYYAFVHFGMNTFTDHEWGEGRAPASDFNPTAFDARQWARTVKEAGMRGIIITAKHHDGFCLWPSRTTEYSVKNSRWRNGQGDVLRELADACREYGLKFGVYISPWDRNHPLYGAPRYNNVYEEQWREILTNYGPVFEAWMDGANDNKKRMVYDFAGFVSAIRRQQPDAVIFSDAGPDIRWVGNERGFAGETNWSPRADDGAMPGFADEAILNAGNEDGTRWIPAECDVSLRPGWFYHAEEDARLKSVKELLDIYYASVGRNANLLLNIGVDRRGLVNEHDAQRLREFKRALDAEFGQEVRPVSVKASHTRGRGFEATQVLDDKLNTYWATPENVTNATLDLDFGREVEFNRLLLQENIALGQRVKKFSLQVWNGTAFIEAARATTIGYKRILRFPTVKTRRARLVVEDAKTGPTIARVAFYRS